jgi:hypothetical protein
VQCQGWISYRMAPCDAFETLRNYTQTKGK